MDPILSQNLSQDTRLELQQKLTPQMLLSIKILQKNSAELSEFLRNELAENPFLELKEVKNEEEGEKKGTLGEGEGERFGFGKVEAFWEESFDSSGIGRRRIVEEEDRKHQALQNTPDDSSSLYDHLLAQLPLLEVPEKIRRIAEQIIYFLNEDGYLEEPLEEVAKSLSSEMDLTEEELEKALRCVQSLEPRGVGARDLKECLLLQLEEYEDVDFERILIEHHLEDLLKNLLPKIARERGVSVERVKKALEVIRQLDPWPGRAFKRVEYIRPDVVVEEGEDGDYEIQIVGTPEVGINESYRDILEEVLRSKRKRKEEREEEAEELQREIREDPEKKKFLKEKYLKARELVDALEKRHSTLKKITAVIVDRQKDFLRYGISKLRPLTMQEVADELGLHVSTVSRALSEKYIQTPQGIFSFHDLFSRGRFREDGTLESTQEVKEKIRRLIEGEDKKNPLSDGEIAEILRKEGLPISRRTVTKYRNRMGIPSARKRKEF